MPRIFIADDEWVTRVEIDEMLTDLGYEVVGQAETGIEAIDMVRSLEPDLIIMDVMMPGEMNGIDAARVIKAELGTPIIFITGYGDPEYIEAAKEIAPFGYVMKPFDEKEIHASVEIALSKRELELKLMKAHEGLERANLILQKEIASRKKTEKALQESERLYRDIFEKNKAIKWVLDPSTGKIIDANSAACEFYQYSHEEMTKLYLWDINLLGESEMKKFLASAALEEQTEFTFKHRKASGEICTVQIYTGTFESGGEMLLHSIIIDITDRHRAKEALQESEKKFSTLFQASPVYMSFSTLDEGRFLEVNDAFTKITGYAREEVLGRTPAELGMLPNPEKRLPFIKLIQEHGEFHQEEIEFRTRNGDSLFGLWSAERIELGGRECLVNALIDISERKRAESKLKENEEKYRLLADNITDNIWILDLGTLRFSYVSPSVIGITGYSAEEATGLHLQDVLPPPSMALAAKTLSEELSEESRNPDPSRSRILELEQYHKNGTTVCTEISMRFIRDAEGRPSSILGVTRDTTQRKQAEEALQDSEARQKALSEASFEAIFISEKGICLDQNQSAERMFGYTSTEAIGKYGTEWIVPEDHEQVKNNMLSEHVKPYEVTALRKDGTTFPCEIQARMTDYQGRSVRITALRDISDRKQAEEALRESEKRYKSLTNNLNVGVYRNSVGSKGNFIEANPAIVKMFGYKSREEFLKIGVSHLYRNPHKRKEFVSKIVKTGSTKNEVLELQKKDGTVFIGSVSAVAVKNEHGDIEYFDGIIEDITERKRANSKLQESEERLKLALDSVSDAVWDWRVDTGEVYFSSRWYTMLGYDPYELPQAFETWSDLLHPDDLSNAEQTISRHLNSAKPFEMEFRMRTKHNQWKWILARGKTVEKSSEGNALRMLGTHMDITDRIKTENDKKALEAQLQNAQKMEAIGTLAGGIAHDFNNLLMAIQSRTSMILLNKDSSHPDFEHLKGIEDHVESAANLTRQLLGFAKGGKYEVRPTNLNELIKKENQMFARTKKEITIGEKYEENLCSVEIDQGQIQQVLLNLYVNAWQAMPGGGNLYVETENVTLDENYVKPFSVKPGRYVKTSITDTGIGMDKAIQKRIFDPFFTTKEMGRGTGLGLASAYGIVRNHGGFISVNSEKDNGSTFDIYLPASLKEVVKEEKPTGGTLKGSETVLFVDDEDMIIEVAEALLNRLGYMVLTARSGKEAIKIYEENSLQIDLVVLDMIMPDMGGGDTYDGLKMLNPKVRVLLSSGYSIDGQATEILDRGCNGFIQKPFKLKEFSQKLRNILDKE